MNRPDRQELFRAARDALLNELPDIWAIYVYGSWARGEQWPQSDLDLAVLLPPGREISDPLVLAGAVARCVGREVDVVDLRKAGNVLRHEVLVDGETLHNERPDEVLYWEASAISRYAHHREEIRALLEDFRRTGIGYAG